MSELSEIKDLIYYNYMYRIGTPVISDQEYDALHLRLSKEFPDHYFFNSIEPEPISKSGGEVLSHVRPMLSLKKAFYHDGIMEWMLQVKKVSDSFNVDPVIYITPKIDGVAVEITKKYLITRGDGKVGLNVTHLIGKGLVIHEGTDSSGEIAVLKDYYINHLSDRYKHHRVVSSAVVLSKNINSLLLKALEDKAIHLLPHADLPCEKYLLSMLIEKNEDFFDVLASRIRDIPYFTDGIVFDVRDKDIIKSLGTTKSHPKYKIARKYLEYIASTTVTDIIISVSNLGTRTPIVLVEPIVFNGITVNRVNCNSVKTLKDKGIKIGTKILVELRGGVIPVINKVLSEPL